tara:strand:- start:361 stop:741 length:381 start_codon:yes stop_codon:yes gene_type:complete
MNKYIELARALQPPCHSVRQFHVTFALAKKKILAIGINGAKTNPKTQEFAYVGDPYQIGTHSELAAVIKLGRLDCSRLTFINVRLKKDGKVALSKPCVGCEDMLNQIGFKRVFYTLDNGNYGNIEK